MEMTNRILECEECQEPRIDGYLIVFPDEEGDYTEDGDIYNNYTNAVIYWAKCKKQLQEPKLYEIVIDEEGIIRERYEIPNNSLVGSYEIIKEGD